MPNVASPDRTASRWERAASRSTAVRNESGSTASSVRVDVLERGGEGAAHRVVDRSLADALDGGPQAFAELGADGVLQPDEAGVPEAAGEADHRGAAACPARSATAATVPKATAFGSSTHDLRHPALGRRQL